MRDPGSPDGAVPAALAGADSGPETPEAAGPRAPASFFDLRFFFSNKRSPAARSPRAMCVEPHGIYGPRWRGARFEAATGKAFHGGHTPAAAGRQSSGRAPRVRVSRENSGPGPAPPPRLAFHRVEV